MVEEEIIVGGNGSHQLVHLKPGPKNQVRECDPDPMVCSKQCYFVHGSKLNPNNMLDYILTAQKMRFGSTFYLGVSITI